MNTCPRCQNKVRKIGNGYHCSFCGWMDDSADIRAAIADMVELLTDAYNEQIAIIDEELERLNDE